MTMEFVALAKRMALGSTGLVLGAGMVAYSCRVLVLEGVFLDVICSATVLCCMALLELMVICCNLRLDLGTDVSEG